MAKHTSQNGVRRTSTWVSIVAGAIIILSAAAGAVAGVVMLHSSVTQLEAKERDHEARMRVLESIIPKMAADMDWVKKYLETKAEKEVH